MSILRQIFGPSKLKNEGWRQFCDQFGGEFVPCGFLRGSEVQVRYKQWTITLETFSESDGPILTQMRTPFVNRRGFRFTIYRKTVFSDLGKKLGMQDIEIGEPEFDDAFIIKGNDESKLRALFGNPTIRQLIEQQPDVHLTVRDDEGWHGGPLPEGVHELCCRVPGEIDDVGWLVSYFDLLVEVLDYLHQTGSASGWPPRRQFPSSDH
ncbi:MAG TPA: hypothetical protein VGX78_09720 [Pirellulales bacterium]|jgi:hypothetical protein|nr:hypothetical protein [Pirellulales bacterium]